MFKESLKSWPIVLSLVSILLLLNQVGFTQFIDRTIYDSFLVTKQQPPPDDIVIIAIDEKSIDVFGR